MTDIERSRSIWGSLREWKFIAYWVVGVSILFAGGLAWGERSFLSAFVGWLFAIWLHMAYLFGTLIGSIYAGVWVAKKFGKHSVGWVAGAVVFVALASLGRTAIDLLPDMKWRIDLMHDSGDDY